MVRICIGLSCFVLFLPWAGAQTLIMGKVIEVGSEVKVEYEGDYAPKKGDPAEIGFKSGEDFIPAKGTWTVVKVEAGFVLLKGNNTESNNVAVEYLVNVHSTEPVLRSSLVPPEIVTNGIVAKYDFENNADDSSGQENNGIVKGNVSYVAGVLGKAVQFGDCRSNGHIRIPNSDSIRFSDACSFAYFLNLTSSAGIDAYGKCRAQSDIYGFRCVFAKDHDRNGFANLISFADFLNIDFTNNDFSSQKSRAHGEATQNYKTGTWVHICIVADNNKYIIYVNGNEISRNENQGINFSVANKADLYLGKFKDNWYPLGGCIDDFRVYSRALTASEVDQLASQITK